ncbi:MAG: ABC transporter permease [Deltaproteobacteria bacterium]|nr:ABC transporter permease [Deltaproteobacteria bacterium]
MRWSIRASPSSNSMSQPIIPDVNEPEDQTFGDIVWIQFKKNRVAYWSLWGLAGLFILAIVAPVIASGRPFIWNAGDGAQYPWFSSLFDRNYFENPVDVFFNLLLVLALPIVALVIFRLKQIQKLGLDKRPRRAKIQRESRFLVLGFLVLLIGVLATPYGEPYTQYEDLREARLQEIEAGASTDPIQAVFPPVPYMFRKTGFKTLEKPSLKHWLGVDESTRDVAVRLLYGTRISLTIGVIAVGIYVTIGIILGSLAGFFSGKVDIVIQRLIEIVMSIPSLIIILVLVAFLEKTSIFHIMLVIGLVRWTGVARLVRGEFYRLRGQDFVTSAVALGFPTWKVIFHHILPNAMGPVLVAATFGVAGAILLESTLSFLGLGDLSAPSWGQTLSEGYSSGAWHLIIAPGFAIFLTVSLLNLVGEGLRDALDPKMRK